MTTLALTYVPIIESLHVYHNGVEAHRNTWTFDAAENAVVTAGMGEITGDRLEARYAHYGQVPVDECIIDTFTRADASSLGYAETGEQWLGVTGYASMGVISGQAYAATDSINSMAVVQSGRSDGTLKATVTTQASTGNPGLIFRLLDRFNYWYLDLTPSFGDCALNLLYDNFLYEIAFFPGTTGTFKWEVVLDGDSIVVKRDGVQVLSVNDPTLQGETKHGMYAFRSSTRFDDFSWCPGPPSFEFTTTNAVGSGEFGGMGSRVLNVYPPRPVEAGDTLYVWTVSNETVSSPDWTEGESVVAGDYRLQRFSRVMDGSESGAGPLYETAFDYSVTNSPPDNNNYFALMALLVQAGTRTDLADSDTTSATSLPVPSIAGLTAEDYVFVVQWGALWAGATMTVDDDTGYPVWQGISTSGGARPQGKIDVRVRDVATAETSPATTARVTSSTIYLWGVETFAVKPL